MKKQSINSVYNNFFKEIIEDKDGNINKRQLKKELFDFREMIDNNTKLFSRLTGGIFSKPNTSPDVIFETAGEQIGNEIKSDIRFDFMMKVNEGSTIEELAVYIKSIIPDEDYLYLDDESDLDN